MEIDGFYGLPTNFTRIQSEEPGTGQVLTLQKMKWENELIRKNIGVEYQWVPAHRGIEDNEQADLQTVKAAYKHQEQFTKTPNPLPELDFVSFARIS